MLSAFFIRRPVFAAVVAIIMVIAGAVSIPQMAIEQYPQVAPPTVQVTATYPGASAATVADTVAAPIEQEVNGVEGMLYMGSVSSDDGSYSLTITFELGTDLDLASVRVQNRVAFAEPRLPEDVRRQGVVTRKQSTSLLMVLAPYSPDGRYDQLFLSNYVTINMRDALSRVPGVGNVQVFGAKDFAMRIWLDPEKLAARNLTTADVTAALREQNVQVAAGRIGAEPTDADAGFQLTLRTLGRLSTVEQFEEIILKVERGKATVRLEDVARVELGARTYDQFGRFNGQPAPVTGIYQLPGSNALEVAQGVRDTLDELREDFPPGMDTVVFFDFTNFVSSSIRQVVITLLIAAGLVFVTVFVFLQDWRATLIPGAAIPVSLVATFAVLLALGLSLNVLTLFGLVLAIGIVVDDAIVVVENTARIINEEDKSPRDAAFQSMREITGPVVATTLVLLAVFVPTLFIPGISGELFREFGITLSVATVFSSVNALTLSPALCGILLRKREKKPALPFRWFNKALDGARSSYLWAVKRALRVTFISGVVLIAMAVGVWFLWTRVPSGFLPQEDQSYFFVNVQLPDAAKLARTDDVLSRAERMVLDTEGVDGVVTIGGFSLLTNANQPSVGTLVVILEPWEQRTTKETSIDSIVGALRGRFGGILEANVFPFIPPSIRGLGQAGGFQMEVQDREGQGYEALDEAARSLAQEGNQNEDLTGLFSNFSARVPQVFVEIDRTKAKQLGVPLDVLFGTLQTQLGSAYVNDFNIFGRVYQVRAQADHPYRQSIDDVLNLEVRNNEGDVLPLSTLATARLTTGPATIFRYNVYPAASITGNAAPGVSTGVALEEMESLARRILPDGFGWEWTGVAYQQKQAGNAALYALAFAVVMAFLFLAAQYESWVTPLAIMATVPVGVIGALALTWSRDFPSTIFTQIGLVLLIALASKNAILIVEFAEQVRKSGTPMKEAAAEAARLRFRPILMTSFAFVLGTSPLLFASGAGAEGRQMIGTAVVGGMILVVVAGTFFIPTMYGLVRLLLGRPAKQNQPNDAESDGSTRRATSSDNDRATGPA